MHPISADPQYAAQTMVAAGHNSGWNMQVARFATKQSTQGAIATPVPVMHPPTMPFKMSFMQGIAPLGM